MDQWGHNIGPEVGGKQEKEAPPDEGREILPKIREHFPPLFDSVRRMFRHKLKEGFFLNKKPRKCTYSKCCIGFYHMYHKPNMTSLNMTWRELIKPKKMYAI